MSVTANTTERRAGPAQPRAAPTTLAARQTQLAWLLLAPALAVVALVALVPLAQTVAASFTNARLAGIEPTRFVGLDNYAALLGDYLFWQAARVTLGFAVITVTGELVLGLVVALVVNSRFRGRGLLRAAMLVPWAIPTVISGQMWKWMYNDVYGVVNDLLVVELGVLPKNVAWVAEPSTAIWAIAAIDIWKTTPFMALLLLAGLQIIPDDLYEAARVDGASAWQQFWTITLPLLRPAIAVALIFRTLDALRVFDLFYVMFGARPDTMTLAVYNQQTIVDFSDVGYGATISVAIFAIIAVVVAIYLTFLKVEEPA
jgi:trehalose/maltose transport system permease protein